MSDSEQTIEQQQDTQAAPQAPGAQQAPGEPGAAETSAVADGVQASADGVQASAAGESESTPSEGAGQDEDALQGDVDELVTLAAQRDEYLALAQRTQADFENYRKRVARDTAVAAERGVAKLVKELLPALDNLDRALDAAEVDDPLLEGVRLVRSELSAALARVGVESFAPLGEVFDPAEHEAMVQQPVEGADSGTVAEVYQPGYRLGASVIRPARVLVAA
jgi:molecular chaperone GrpE